MIYVFADCVLDTSLCSLQRAGRTRQLQPKVFEVCRYLLEHRDRVISQDELIEQVWPDQSISDNTLESTIREIRQVLGDRGRTQRLIQTLHGRGRGYRFVAAVEERPTSPPESVAQPSDNRFDHLDIPLPTAATPHAPALRATTPQLSPPRHLADTILAMRRALEGERKQVTVLCATVVGFSTLAERLAPDDLHTLMGGCFTLLAEQVHRYEGVINQFTSDGMMALFGAPIVHEDHAVRALLTALGIQTALHEYQGEIERCWEVPLQMHLGLHTGTVIVGRIGDNLQMHYTVQGDTTSLAAQMQQMAPPGAIWVSEETYRAAREAFVWQAVGLMAVQGKPAPVPVYALLSPREAQSRFEVRTRQELTRFVGRDPELQRLLEAWERAERGTGQVVSVVGEAGIGKSRLVYEFKQCLIQQGGRYLEGPCFAYGEVISYLPFLTIVRGLCGLQGRETRAEAAAQIQHHLRTLSLDAKVVEPYLNHLFTLPVEDDIISTSSPDLVRQRTVEALKTLLLAEVQHRPGVLILEDVHWIDTASEEVLTALVTAMGTSPLLLVLVYRPEYVHAWAHTVSHIQGTLTRLPDVSSAAMVRAILAKPYAIQVLLERLPPTQSQAMVQDILGTTGLPPQVEQFIATKTDGNPLFVEELTRALVESGVLVREPEGYRSRTALTTLTIPAAVQGVLLARVDRLPEALKTVLQTASVIGRVFSYLLLAGVVPPGTELDRSLLQLEEREFVYPLSLMPHHELSFKHVLTQEVVYDSLLQERRRALHARIVTAIEALAGEWMADQVELLAHHALRGEVWDKALTYLRQAGEKAMALSAYSEAVGYFEQALGVLPHLPEQRDTREQAIDLRLALRMALLPSGDLGRMLAVLREAETLAVALDDPRRLGRVSGSLSLHFYFMGAYDQAIATAQRALALATASGDIVLHAEANRHLGFSYHVQGDYRRAIDGFKQTMAFFDGGQRYERFSLMLPTVQCRAWLAWCHAELGMFAEGRVLGEEGLRIAEAIAHPASLMAASWGVGLLALRQGDLSTALPLLERAVGICQEASIPSHFPLMAAPLGAAYTLGGRVADAVPPLTKAVAQTTVMEMRGVQALCSLSLGEAQLLVGRLEEAHALAERTLAHARAHQERGHQAYALRLLGEIAARREPLEAVPAADYYWQALALAEELGMCPLVAHCHRGLGVLYASIGQREQARTELSTAIALYRALDMTFWLPQVEAALAQMSGC